MDKYLKQQGRHASLCIFYLFHSRKNDSRLHLSDLGKLALIKAGLSGPGCPFHRFPFPNDPSMSPLRSIPNLIGHKQFLFAFLSKLMEKRNVDLYRNDG